MKHHKGMGKTLRNKGKSKARGQEMTRSAARAYMVRNLKEHTDRITNEVNLTSLAESCCRAFNCSDEGGPLDQEDHWIWDVAADFSNGR